MLSWCVINSVEQFYYCEMLNLWIYLSYEIWVHKN